MVGETLERAVRYRESYDPAKGRPVSCLLGIGRHCADEAIARRLTTPPPLALTSAGDLEEDALQRVAIRSVVGRLDESDRELIALRFGADLTARQIAEHLGVRTNTVEVRLHRALAQLRAMLDGEPQRGVSVSPPTPVVGEEETRQRPWRAA